MFRTRFKICCIQTIDEAQLAIRYGASAIGLVSKMPSGPGPIDEERIAEIAATIPAGVSSFLLTCLQDVDSIIAQQRRCGANTIQLCDHLLHGTHADLRRALPGIAIVQVVHICDHDATDEVRRLGDSVHAILLDSGNQKLAIKELGGTGRVHDWEISRTICETARVPVFLAGGLKPTNVAEAIRKVRPFGVDVCSGLRTDDQLDESKLAAFVEQINQA